MALELSPPLAPMEAATEDEIPEGEGWQYEPKWDGFRCIVFRDGAKIELQSKSGQPLARYFPEVVANVAALKPKQFVLDSELVIPEGKGLSFDALLLRLHPAESRVRKLAASTPALVIVFDLLADTNGRSMLSKALAERRVRLEQVIGPGAGLGGVRLSPATTSLAQAKRWFKQVGGALDGVIAKRVGLPYEGGNRTGMVKVKKIRTADCVVGGFRYGMNEKLVGSLLLGLYGEDGLLHHVCFCSGIKVADKPALTKRLECIVQPPGFSGRAPGGPSRWNPKREGDWQPLKTELVVEVQYDHFTGGRFRHGTGFVRWRPDKAPGQCTLDQIETGSAGLLKLLG